MPIYTSEATQDRRRVYFHLVDATDGKSPELLEAGGQPQLSVNGAAWADSSGTLVAVGNGSYYLDLSLAEIGTLGMLLYRYKSGNTAEFQDKVEIVAYNPHDATRLGLSYLNLLGKQISEPTAPMADSPTMEEVLAHLAERLSAIVEATSQWVTLKKKNGTAFAKMAISDDGTTFELGKQQAP